MRDPWPFAAACAVAGALAVPLDAVATPVSAAVAGLLGLVGLHVWRWSRLPRLLQAEERDGRRRLLQPATWMGLGLVVGLLVLGVIRLAIEPALPAIGARIASAGTLPVWRRLVIIFVAAVGEELVFRLVLLSLIAGLATRLRPRPLQVPSLGVIWAANALSALAFAAAHLPAWSGAMPPGAALALSVLTLNALGGLVCGYVFVSRGIVAAMWVHAGGDCAIQLLGPVTG